VFRRWELIRAWRRMATLPIPLRIADMAGWVDHPAEHAVARRVGASVLRIAQWIPVQRQLELIESFEPHILVGPPTALDLLGRFVHQQRATVGSLKLVASRGETLFEPVRAMLSEAFDCPVADYYSCEEVGVVASECPALPDQLHVNTDACVVETVDEEGNPTPQNREGRILLTNLYNFTMPFIRYDIGDHGTLLPSHDRTPCACGSWRPRMRLVGGRNDEYVFFPDGRRMSPRLLGTAIYRAAVAPKPDGDVAWLFRGFQANQDALDHVTVRVLADEDAMPRLEEAIRRELRNVHAAFRCTIVRTDHIPLEPSGKQKKVKCSITAGGESIDSRDGSSVSGS